MSISIKKNEEIQNGWIILGDQISELGNIIENDREIDIADYIKWMENLSNLYEKFTILRKITTDYINPF